MSTRLTVLVVGATGSIGRLVVEEALREGHAVRALVRNLGRARQLPPEAQVVVGDVTPTGVLPRLESSPGGSGSRSGSGEAHPHRGAAHDVPQRRPRQDITEPVHVVPQPRPTHEGGESDGDQGRVATQERSAQAEQGRQQDPEPQHRGQARRNRTVVSSERSG